MELDPPIGENIAGPSLIKVSPCIKNPLGRYYLYFASHKGTHIKLAFSDILEGSWKIHKEGRLNFKVNKSRMDSHLSK